MTKKIWKPVFLWFFLFSYFGYYMITNNNIEFLYFFLPVYLMFIGSFIYYLGQTKDISTIFLYLMFDMAISFLFLYSSNLFFNNTGIFLLTCCPVLLYLFLYNFIESQDRLLLRNNLIKLSLISVVCFFSFIFRFQADVFLFFLMLCTFFICYSTLRKERRLFYNTTSYKIFCMSIAIIFIPFLFSYSLPIIFTDGKIGHPDVVLLIIALPTCIAYLLIYSKKIFLNKKNYGHVTLAFLTLIFFYLTITFDLSFREVCVTTIMFFSFFYLHQYLKKVYETNEIDKLTKNFENFENERVEIFNQITYQSLHNNISNILLEHLKCEIESNNILVLMKSNNEVFFLGESSVPGSYIFKKVVRTIKLSGNQVIEIKGKKYMEYSYFNNTNGLILFLENTNTIVNTTYLNQILENYLQLLLSTKLLYQQQEKYIDSSVEINQKLQIKLFDSLEKEKIKFTHYLHDDVLQSVLGIKTLVSNLRGNLEIEDLIKLEFSKLIYSIRDEIYNISPSTLYHLNFKENIEILIDEFNKKYQLIQFSCNYQEEGEIPKYLISPLYRIIKELNENVGKHSNASSSETKINIFMDSVVVTVQDNGIGINDFYKLEKNLVKSKEHIGLLSIKNDVNWLNGSLKIQANENNRKGTLIDIFVPIERSFTNEDFTN